MNIGIAKEVIPGEKRVALLPDSIAPLKKLGLNVLVESGAGLPVHVEDAAYTAAGATVVSSFEELAKADIIAKVRPLSAREGYHEADKIKEGGIVFSVLDPHNSKETIQKLVARKASVFALEFIPRITLAQSMDILSSMATIAGYRAVLKAAEKFDRFLPMLMTAAGTIRPAKVIVLGAGVAGLQAIATAKRLGALVEAFDVRPVVKEQVESLGAKFIEVENTENLQDEQGYAKEASAEFLARQKEVLARHLSKADMAITTAQVFGKKAPVLITAQMVHGMKPGSVIVDLAAEQGGNCELTKVGQEVIVQGVRIFGPRDIVSEMAPDASAMFSNNVVNLLKYLVKEGNLKEDEKDEILNRTRIMKSGEVTSDIVRALL